MMRILFTFLLTLLLSAVSQLRSNALAVIYDATDTLRSRKINDTNIVISCPIEVIPQFPGGEAAQRKFIANLTFFPDGTQDIQGRVILGFKVDKYGCIDSIKVLRRLHPKLDSIAVDIVKQMPQWKPALRSGQQVEAKMILPIGFIPE